MAGLIPQSVSDTFGELLATYQQIEAIKLQKRLADAQISLASAALPSQMQDAQAKAQSVYTPMGISPAVAIGALIIGAAALYAIVK